MTVVSEPVALGQHGVAVCHYLATGVQHRCVAQTTAAERAEPQKLDAQIIESAPMGLARAAEETVRHPTHLQNAMAIALVPLLVLRRQSSALAAVHPANHCVAPSAVRHGSAGALNRGRLLGAQRDVVESMAIVATEAAAESSHRWWAWSFLMSPVALVQIPFASPPETELSCAAICTLLSSRRHKKSCRHTRIRWQTSRSPMHRRRRPLRSSRNRFPVAVGFAASALRMC